MKKVIAVLVTALVASAPVAAADLYYDKHKAEGQKARGEASEGMALVYGFQPRTFLSRLTWMFLDDRLVIVSRASSYSFTQVPEGEYSLWMHAAADWLKLEDGPLAEVTLEGGKTYYYEIRLREAFFRMRVSVEAIHEERAEELFADLAYAEPTGAGRARAAEIVAEKLGEVVDRAEEGGTAEGLAIPLFHQDGELAWKVGHSAESEAQHILELVRPDESVEDWTELVTVHTLNKAAGLGSIEDHLAGHRDEVTARCPASTVEVLRQGPDGALYELRVLDCERGPDEHILGRILEGESNRFVVHYAVRDPVSMTADRREEWIDKLTALEIAQGPR